MSTLDAGTASAGNVGPADERPLTQQEYQLLQRLLSDPFSLPIQFKTWLISFLETSDMNLPLSAVAGLTAMLGISGLGSGSLGILPAGIILPYGADSAPAGALMCDGASYSRTTQSRLWNAIGSRFGTPDANTFNVPDLRERIPVGKGTKSGVSQISQNEGRPLGQRGPVHGHSKNGTVTKTGTVNLIDPTHHHGLNAAGGTTGVTAGGTPVPDLSGVNTAESATGITIQDTIAISDTISVGPQSGAPIDTPAFLVITFIIIA